MTDTGSTHAFVYSAGSIKDLGTLGGQGSDAYDINDDGDIVGFAYRDLLANHAFVFRDGLMQDLGAQGEYPNVVRSRAPRPVGGGEDLSFRRCSPNEEPVGRTFHLRKERCVSGEIRAES